MDGIDRGSVHGDARRRDPINLGSLTKSGVRHALVLVATCAICATMCIGSTKLAQTVKINTTDSMPLGIYLLRPALVAPGRIVVACPPAAAVRLGLQNG